MPAAQLTTLLHRLGRGEPPPPIDRPHAGPHLLGSLERAGRQRDGRSCGVAVLLVLLALGDPSLRAWLADGVPPRPLPDLLRPAPTERLAALGAGTAQERAAALQRVLTHRVTRRALLGAPWPAALGTPPWTLAREARYPSVRYRHIPMDATDRPHVARVLDRVVAAAGAAVPVPLYSGGDLGGGLAAAVPRHVVLVVGHDDGGFFVWEPGAGRVVVVDRSGLTAGAPHPALGGWSHLTWAVLPVDPLA